jgi:hypothetical protein
MAVEVIKENFLATTSSVARNKWVDYSETKSFITFHYFIQKHGEIPLRRATFWCIFYEGGTT